VQVFSDMPKLWRLTRKNLGAPIADNNPFNHLVMRNGFIFFGYNGSYLLPWK